MAGLTLTLGSGNRLGPGYGDGRAREPARHDRAAEPVRAWPRGSVG
jgi:hypothetical protein